MKAFVFAALALFAVSAHAGDRVRGEQLAKDKACASCHGADYNTPIDPSYPKLAGQYEDYLYKALLQYRRGAQGDQSQALARNNPVMGALAAPLSNRDKQDLAAYLASLPTLLTHKK
jgi:cytochrome c553